MRIALISRDGSLLPLCQDVAAKLPEEHCEVFQTDPEQTVEADVYLWDLDCNPRTPFVSVRPPATDVFLVRRAILKSFLNRYPEAAPSTLLKPVSPAALEVFLTHLIDRRSAADEENIAHVDRLEADRERLLESLLHATLRLQEFEEERTNFWARASHDLRAPLTAASGYCELLLEAEMGPLNEDQRDLLQRVQHSLRKLNRMASAMFQLTAGRQLERKYELKRVDLEASIRRSIAEIEFFALEKNLAVTSEIASPEHPLYVEPTQIEQVMVNLLENACKFTPRNGSVRVRAYPVHGTAPGVPTVHGAEQSEEAFNGYRVDVCDSGPGIAPENLQCIFDEYVSYGSLTDRSGGGLGLAICKMILRSHGGEIWAETTGRGTIISFVLPFNHAAGEERYESAANHAG